jgi:hypothetical protein
LKKFGKKKASKACFRKRLKTKNAITPQRDKGLWILLMKNVELKKLSCDIITFNRSVTENYAEIIRKSFLHKKSTFETYKLL